MVLPFPDAWPGGLPCPWTRGTVDTEAAARPPGTSGGGNDGGPDWIRAPGVAGRGGGVGHETTRAATTEGGGRERGGRGWGWARARGGWGGGLGGAWWEIEAHTT